jgi:hypothetical protein
MHVLSESEDGLGPLYAQLVGQDPDYEAMPECPACGTHTFAYTGDYLCVACRDHPLTPSA